MQETKTDLRLQRYVLTEENRCLRLLLDDARGVIEDAIIDTDAAIQNTPPAFRDSLEAQLSELEKLAADIDEVSKGRFITFQ